MQNRNGIITDKEMKNRRDTSELEKQFYSSSDYPSHKPQFMQDRNNGRNFMTTNSYDSLLAKEEIEMPCQLENGTNIVTEYADALSNKEKVNFNKIFPIWNNTTTSYIPQLSEAKFSTPEFSEPQFSSSPIAEPSPKPPSDVIQKSELHTNNQNEENRLHTNDYNEDNMPQHQRCLRETNVPVLLAFLRKHNMFGHSSTDSESPESHSDYESANSSTKFYKMLTQLMTHIILLTHLKPHFITHLLTFCLLPCASASTPLILPNFIKMLTQLMTHIILLTHLKPRFITHSLTLLTTHLKPHSLMFKV